MSTNKELRPGIVARTNGVITIDPELIYPEILKTLGVKEIDQYWAEVAYQCAKLEAMRMVEGTKYDPRPDKSLVVHVESRKDTWALSNFPVGRGATVATRGREAREHYRRWRELDGVQ